MSKQQLWSLLIIAVITGLVLCAVPMMLNSNKTQNTSQTSASEAADSANSGAGSESDETASTLDTSVPTSGRPACTDGSATSADGEGASSSSPLNSVTLPCLGHSSAADSQTLAQRLAGKPTIINVWAYWCQPCKAELPIVESVAHDHPEWNVVGIHEDQHASAGTSVLKDLHLTDFASFQDSHGDIAKKLGLPAVIPITIVLRPDATVAKIYPQTFTSQSQLEQAVNDAL